MSKVVKSNSPQKPSNSPPKDTPAPAKVSPPKTTTVPAKQAPVQPAAKSTPAPAKSAPTPAKSAPAPAKSVPAPSKNTPPPAPSKSKFDPKAYVKNGVSQQEVTAVKTAFDLFDSDQGGTVDIKELKAAMTSLGFESKNGSIFQMISDLDTDGNGTIDFGEWFNLMTKRVNDKDTRDNIAKIFYLFDDQKTGYISVKNLRRVAQELGENISEEELQELINRADVDQDGLVSQEEFYTIVTRKIKD